MGGGRVTAAAMIVCLLALAVLPFIADKFTVQLLTKMMIMAIFAMSLDLLVGYTGLVSLGHAAFFGISGYILALATPQYQAANFWISLPLAVAGAGVLALAIGCLVLRVTGVYFIMVTLAFAQMLHYIFHDTGVAGGSDGMYIYLRPDASIFGWRPFDLEKFGDFYFVVLALFVAVFLFLRVVLRSLFGQVISGVHVNEGRMRSLGFPTFRYKLASFVLAGMLAGMAGYLSAVQFGVVNPDMLGWHLSGSVLMMVILGGMGSLVGPIVGAFAMMLLELGFQSLTKHWQLPMGLAIVLVALLLPRGLVGLASLRARNKETADA
ncbi:MAG TPA: branched-chain amino acid ABC transporter permease [Burkholderiales bacterium]|jgi:branched-chain amino acid transport system permease protein|nr:branched-chain amino acid ABC transporter permease [Burkholderiales bacterium]